MPPTRVRLRAGIVATLFLLGITVAAVRSVAPPAVVPASAPADEFSAARAYTHVETIGAAVHVAGSAAQAKVRDHIVSTLTGLGLRPTIQAGVGATGKLGGPYAMAAVRNIVAVIPGSASTGRLFLVAHYDSVQVSYGGNDDGAGVATLLETARALKAAGPLRNDIVLLFTDAEEACLCGAEAFVSQDPLAAAGGVVLNFESRGSSGPAIMFETSRGNNDVVATYGSSVPDPVATSFAVEVYRILPNDTDFTPFRESGRFSGLNTAYIDGSAVYHSPEDRPEYMDQRSLQQHGGNALALARAFGAEDLAGSASTSGSDATYFPVLGGLVRYSGTLVWPIAVLALLLAIGTAALAARRGVSSWWRSAAGLGLAVVPVLAAAVGAQLLWLVLTLLRPGYADMIDPWRPGFPRAAVIALVASVTLTWLVLLRRRFGVWPLVIGNGLLLAVLGVVLAAVTPGGSYLASLPAGAAALGTAGALLVTDLRWRAVAFTLPSMVGLLILAPTVALFFPALGLATGAAPAFFAALAALTVMPVVDLLLPDVSARPRPRRRWTALPPVLLGVLTLALVGTGLVVDRFDATHPAPVQLGYLLDTDTGKAQWMSDTGSTGDWVDGYVHGTGSVEEAFGLVEGTVRTGPAIAANLPAPVVAVVSDVRSGRSRSLTFTIAPQRDVRLIYLNVPRDVRGATIDGREVASDRLGGGLSVVFHAPPTQGLTVVLQLDSIDPVPVRVMDGSDGLAGLPGFVARPVGVGVKGSHSAELVLVAATRTI